MATPVTIGPDQTLPLFGIWHAAAFVPPGIPPTPAWPHVEPSVPIEWKGGQSAHKLASTVLHRSASIAQEAHDCGPLIAHITAPPYNVLLPLFVACSKRKASFSASTVKMDGKSTGVIAPWYPMLNCAEPCSWPVNFAMTSSVNTVYVGVTVGDIILGVLGIVGQIALELLLRELAPWLKHKLLPKELDELSKFVFKTVFKYILKWLAGRLKSVKTAKDAPRSFVGPPSVEHTTSVVHTTSSPFGDFVLELSDAGDGSYRATTSAPGPAGGRSRQTHEGLGVWRPASEETSGPQWSAPASSDLLTHLAEGAPSL